MTIRSRNHTGLRRARRTHMTLQRGYVTRYAQYAARRQAWLAIAKWTLQSKPAFVRGYGRCTVTGRSRKMTAGNVLYEVSGFGRLWVSRERLMLQ